MRGVGRAHPRGGGAPETAGGPERPAGTHDRARAGVDHRPAVRLAAAALLATTALLTGCSPTNGVGARDEGPARTDTVGHTAASPASSASPSPALERVDAVKLVMADEQVGKDVKRALKRCGANGYPVDVSYGKLTGAASADVVVNVMTCDSVGVGSYVYRPDGDRFRDVFRNEQPQVYAEIDRGDLVVTQKVYREDDQLAYPSSEDVITYSWSASEGRFTEQDRTHNDYSNPVGGGKAPTSDN